MKKSLFAMAMLGSFTLTYAQSGLFNQGTPVTGSLPTLPARHTNADRATSCGPDTVLYPLAKASAASLYTLVGNGGGAFGEGFGQFYEAPQPMTIHGVVFYGRAKSTPATVNVRIYSVNPADTTPAVLLGGTTTVLNTSTPSLAAMERIVTFSTPINVTGNYIVAVEGGALATDTFQLVSNADGDGLGERLSSVRILGTIWFNVADGFGVDADFLAHPVVTYNLSANFTTSDSPCLGDLYEFTNTSSPVINSRFYNQAAFFEVPEFSYTWNYGDASAPVNVIDGSHTYAAAGNFNVTLTDSIFGWNMDCIADTSIQVTVSTPPVGMMMAADDTISVGADLDVMLGATGSTTCTMNFGDGTVINTCSDTAHAYLLPGTYELTFITTNDCSSDSVTGSVVVVLTPGAGVDETVFGHVNIYPNPATENIYVNMNVVQPQDVKISIYTLLGTVVKETKVNNANGISQVSLEGLMPGSYFLKIDNGKEYMVRKFNVLN